MGDRKGMILAVAALVVGLGMLLASTRPNVDTEVTSSLRRLGGVCLELERWGLFGWSKVGQTHTVDDIQRSRWKPAVDEPPCTDAPERQYLVRVFAQPPGTYRLCGLVDDHECLEFRIVAT